MLFIIAERRGKKVFLIVRVHDKLLIWLFVLIVLRVYHLSDHIWDPIRGRCCSRFDQWKGERGSQGLPYVWKGGADVWAIVLFTLAVMDDRTVRWEGPRSHCHAQHRSVRIILIQGPGIEVSDQVQLCGTLCIHPTHCESGPGGCHISESGEMREFRQTSSMASASHDYPCIA